MHRRVSGLLFSLLVLSLGIFITSATTSGPQTTESKAQATTIQPVGWWETRYNSSFSSQNAHYSQLSLSDDSWDIYNLAYGIDGPVALYLATGKTQYLDQALVYANNKMRTARVSSSISTSQYKDSYFTWVNHSHPQLGDDGKEYPLYESYGWRYVTRMLRVIRTTPTLYNDPKYKSQYDTLLAFTERNIFDKWYNRSVNDNIYRSRTHMASHWAFIAMDLSVMTSDQTRQTRANKIMNDINNNLPNYNSASLRSQMKTHPKNTAGYTWSAEWGKTTPAQDVSHGNNVIAYLVEAHGQGKNGWTTSEMLKFKVTFDKIIWPSAEKYADTVDGNGNGNGWFPEGFMKLGRYDAALQKRLETHTVGRGLQFYGNGALNAKILGSLDINPPIGQPNFPAPTTITPTLYCLGGVPCTGPSITPRSTSPVPSGSTPPPVGGVPSTVPQPTIDPCQTEQTSALHKKKKHKKKYRDNAGGFFQKFFRALFEFILRLIELILQRGGTPPGTPGNPNPTPCPEPTNVPQPTNQPMPTITRSEVPTSMPTSLPIMTPSNSPTIGTVLWRGDPDAGRNQWSKEHMVSASRVTVETIAGRKAWRMQINDGDNFGGFGERTEFGQDNTTDRDFHNGQDIWIGYSIYLPAGFPTNAKWTVLTQWKDQDPDLGSPSWATHCEGGRIGLNGQLANGWAFSRPCTTGVWHNFVVHHKLSSSSDGLVEAWYSIGNEQLVKVLERRQRTYRTSGKMVPRMGYYRDPTISGNHGVYHAGWTVGTSFDAVNPIK